MPNSLAAYSEDVTGTVAGGPCPLCETPGLELFFEMPETPILLNVVWPTREQALECSQGHIGLAFCANCGCITNLYFEPERMVYDASYENSLHYSEAFQEYAHDLLQELARRHKLCNKVIVEIGCGKGEFLEMLCRFGNNQGIGFDPSSVNARADSSAGRGIKFVQEYYSEAHAAYHCDFLCCRHMLEHMADPRGFLRGVRRAVASTPQAVLYFEVPNARYTLRQAGMWDVIYPHCFYYDSASLRALFTACGFEVTRLEERFGGQYLSVEALPGQLEPGLSRTGSSEDELQALASAVHLFRDHYYRRVDELRQTLLRLRRLGKRTVLWGAGAKGITFLNVFKSEGTVEYVVDVNPNKQGRFVSGTGQQIMSPEFLRTFQPDAVVVTNPQYCSEIARQLQALGLQPAFIPA